MILFAHVFLLFSNALDRFREAWLNFDRHGTKYMKEEHLPALLAAIPPPLGMKGFADTHIEKMIEKLEIPVNDRGLVYFPDLLIILCEHIHDAEGSTEQIRDLVEEFWKASFVNSDTIVKGRRRIGPSLPDLSTAPLDPTETNLN